MKSFERIEEEIDGNFKLSDEKPQGGSNWNRLYYFFKEILKWMRKLEKVEDWNFKFMSWVEIMRLSISF